MYQFYFEKKSDVIFEDGLTPKLSRYVFSDDPDWESGHHVHETETELIYVLKGSVNLTINSSHYIAHAGDIIVIDCGNLHALTSDVSAPAITCACVIHGFKIQGLPEGQILRPNAYPIVSEVQYSEIIKNIFQEINRMLPHNNNMAMPIYGAFAYILATMFYENFKNANAVREITRKQTLIQDILIFLNDNYREKITLQYLSAKFNASVSYICHEFTKEYKISPINYVIKRRITEAKFVLTNTELCVTDISYKVGYENVDHFTKLFISHVGCTPSEYRNKYRNNHIPESKSLNIVTAM